MGARKVVSNIAIYFVFFIIILLVIGGLVHGQSTLYGWFYIYCKSGWSSMHFYVVQPCHGSGMRIEVETMLSFALCFKMPNVSGVNFSMLCIKTEKQFEMCSRGFIETVLKLLIE